MSCYNVPDKDRIKMYKGKLRVIDAAGDFKLLSMRETSCRRQKLDG